MTREEAISNIKMISVAFVDPVTKEQRKLIDDTFEMAIKALEQEPCEDEYIKVPKKALKYRTAGMVAYNAEWLKNNFDIEWAVICGAQEPCGDAISRQDVLDLAKKGVLVSNGNYKSVCKAINELPPVNPQQKTGYWIVEVGDRETGYGGCTMCSECSGEGNTEMDYCPHCGAKMIAPQESEG